MSKSSKMGILYMLSIRIFIHRSCRLRAWLAKHWFDPRGQTMMLAAMMILVILPTTIVLSTFLMQTRKSATQEQHQKLATEYANSIFMDYMCQLSQDPYNGHYDAAHLQRPQTLYNNGFSTSTYAANATNHSLYLKAE